jgi:SAM-dependent methyltransferase
MPMQLPGEVEFAVGDITALQEPSDCFDKAIVTRVVINLGSWELQLQGLHECCRVLKPGGILLLSEASLQGWQALNRFRNEWGLPDIPMPSFNSYLDEQALVEGLSAKMELVETVNFSSTYYIGTRLFKPLLAQVLATDIAVADPEMEWNRFFSQLPSWGDYGTQKLFVFRKK